MSAFLVTCRWWYQAIVRWIASLKSQDGYHPSTAPAFSIESESRAASWGCFGSEPSFHSPGHTFKISSTNRRTGSRADGSGPKLKALARREALPSTVKRAAGQREPLGDSGSCLQGRVEAGLRSTITFISC